MIFAGLVAVLLVADAIPLPSSSPPPPTGRAEYAQLTIQESIVVRVPTRATPPPRIVLHERKADRCQPMEGVAAAAVLKPDSIDIIYRGGQRLRAELEQACPALDYYSGFYIRPTRDGQICAGRDAIRSRAGGECQIKRFRRLVPEKVKAKAKR